MRKEDQRLALSLANKLEQFAASKHALPGIFAKESKDTFIFQLIESVRRIRFVSEVAKRPIASSRRDPKSSFFDPVRGALLFKAEEKIDEAAWLIFLFTHFGKNAKSGYRLVADVYGRLGESKKWDWKRTSHDPARFRLWLDENRNALKASTGVHRGFGNHRKYQSLNAWETSGTGAAFETYITWVSRAGGHVKLFDDALKSADGDPEVAFATLYKSMATVSSFGRTGRFDYLAMIGKVQIADIAPDSVYLDGATGPVDGAKLLFMGSVTSRATNKQLETLSNQLAEVLGLGKQVIEDSLCNWQKSPSARLRFRG